MKSGSTLSTCDSEHDGRLRIALWVAVVALLLPSAAYKERANRSDWEAVVAWRTAQPRFREMQLAERRRVSDLLHPILGQPDSLKKVQQVLADGGEFQVSDEPDCDLMWSAHESAIHASFTFTEDRLTSLRILTGNIERIHPRPSYASRQDGREEVRAAIAHWGRWLWLVWFLLTLIFFRESWLAADILAWIAMTTGAAMLVSPYHEVTWRAVFSNDALALAAVQYFISLVFVAAWSFHLRRNLPNRFSIRALLLATACVAVLLAVGPVGYVALLVLAVGGLFVWLMLKAMRVPLW